MNQTTVLERRSSIRRSRSVPAAASTQVTSFRGRLGDVRFRAEQADSERRNGSERREYLPHHHITVGRVAGSAGWMGGVCSCGEHTLSRVDGLIEEWARWHRQEVMAHRSSFVYTS